MRPAERLSDYVAILAEPPASASGGEVEIDGFWVCLKVAWDQWPKALRDRWRQEFFYLFPVASRTGRWDPKDRLSLCHQTSHCERKGEQSEDRECQHYSQGLCVASTALANNLRPLSFGTIGSFHGISKQRVQQIYCAAQKKVIQAAARDPILREYYTSLGLRPENLPDPEKLAAELEQALR